MLRSRGGGIHISHLVELCLLLRGSITRGRTRIVSNFREKCKPKQCRPVFAPGKYGAIQAAKCMDRFVPFKLRKHTMGLAAPPKRRRSESEPPATAVAIATRKRRLTTWLPYPVDSQGVDLGRAPDPESVSGSYGWQADDVKIRVHVPVDSVGCCRRSARQLRIHGDVSASRLTSVAVKRCTLSDSAHAVAPRRHSSIPSPRRSDPKPACLLSHG